MTSVISFVIVAEAVWLSARLYSLDLHRRYLAFFLYLLSFALQNAVLGVLPQTGAAYQRVWLLTEPIEWLLYVGVVRELFSLVLKDYRGLYTVGRWSIILAVVVAALVSGFSLAVPAHATPQGQLMALYYVTERAVYLSLMVFLVTVLFLITRYPITLNRNIVVHSVVFSVYFLCNAAVFLLLSMRGFTMIRVATYAIQAVNAAALGTWLAMLNAAGEERREKAMPGALSVREEELVHQLNSLNAALLRVTH